MSIATSPQGPAAVSSVESSVSPEPAAPPFLVRRAAVLGAGTMGSRIAAHLANVGIPVLLLDMVPKDESAPRNKLAVSAIDALQKTKPAALYEPALAAAITPGNFEDDLPRLAPCDWVIEAVAENLEIKRALLEKVSPHLNPRALLTTNTSGLPIRNIAAGLPPGIARRFFGTHFFNPPRYMQLLEIIPAPESDVSLIAAFAAFADRQLGKQVVFANDTPNFIANRIGITVMFTAATLMLEQGLSIEEADALTGQVIGWPRTGTFRLADMVGIDVLAHVASNFPEGPSGGNFSQTLQEIVRRGWLGDKAGQGFYKKTRGADGQEQRLALDLKTLEYRPLAKAALPSLDMVKNAPTLKERLKLLLANDPARDKAARFLWPLLATLWSVPAARAGASARRGGRREARLGVARQGASAGAVRHPEPAPEHAGRWELDRAARRSGRGEPRTSARTPGEAASRYAGRHRAPRGERDGSQGRRWLHGAPEHEAQHGPRDCRSRGLGAQSSVEEVDAQEREPRHPRNRLFVVSAGPLPLSARQWIPAQEQDPDKPKEYERRPTHKGQGHSENHARGGRTGAPAAASA